MGGWPVFGSAGGGTGEAIPVITEKAEEETEEKAEKK